MEPLCTFLAVVDADFHLHRWSSRIRCIAFPIPGDCQLMGIRCRIFCLQGALINCRLQQLGF
ncbi:hypothetical protein HMPREF1545_03189 [Oscillibacter sp. KLE 1728]|nr:hypothetical protein HMPREF1545_03189 [Oscillibacter sp. KLE 1728]